MDIKFQKWLLDHQPDDNMRWKDDFWFTYCFWRDRILPMFTDKFFGKYAGYETTIKEIDKNTEIVGEHWSKSIINPVVKITFKGVEIVFRYNFYDYEIAIISQKPIELPKKKLFRSKEESFFYQGFPDEYQVKERYEDNNRKFIAKIYDHYGFYTFMFLLRAAISK